MTFKAIRRPLVWLCPLLAVAAVFAATSHMDYAIDPRDRNGEKWLAEHGGMAFNLAIVVDRAAPCVPAGRTLFASIQPPVR
ncbi:MAG: hypothetical protein F4233_05470 [Rhodospirillaceae bacterium]|nr:hypothetical protein [Rhodospirillaceae bacterium]